LGQLSSAFYLVQNPARGKGEKWNVRMLDWQRHKKLRLCIKTICIVLIISFLTYDLSWAGATEVLSPKNWKSSQETKNSPSIEIPQELGTVKESYISKYNPYKLIIHIQDAHANVEAQENEAELIKYLKEKYRVNLVSVEGGFGDFDAEFFRSFPKDKKIRDKIAKYFLSKAFISGTDYLLITEDEPPTVYGAENRELYTSHLNTFRENQNFSDYLNNHLSVIESVIETLKDKYYSKDLREFDLRANDFKQGRISLEEYLSYLNIVSVINNLDLSKFPNLSRIINLQELEHKINFEQAESERQELIDSLTKVLSKEDLEELVKRSLDFKANKITPAGYYSYLEELTAKAGISSTAYNNLFSYIKYISFSENLDNSKIFEEIDSFTGTAKETLITNSSQKDIDSLTYIIQIIKGLSNINLSPKDYEYFKNNRDAFTSKSIGLVLRRYNSSIINSLPTDEDIASLEKFYNLVYDRDRAIVSNSLNRLNREYNTDSVILVAGGFHTQGITSILKEKDISYIVVAPSIKQSQDRENTYFAFLRDKKLPLQDVLNDPDTLQIINSISDPQARQLLITYWVARASRYYSVKELQAQLDRLNLSVDDQTSVNLALKEISPQTQIAKQETIPASHKEEKEEGITAGKEELKVAEAPLPAQNKDSSSPVIESAPKQESIIKPVPVIPKGPTLFERFTGFIASLKPKSKPIEIKVAKQETVPTSQETESIQKELFQIKIEPETMPPEIPTVKPKPAINYQPFLTGIITLILSLSLSSFALAQDNSYSFLNLFTEPIFIFVSAGSFVGYVIYRVIKSFISKPKWPIIERISPTITQPSQNTEKPKVITSEIHKTYGPKLVSNLPFNFKKEIESRIQELNKIISEGSKSTLSRSFRPIGPAELPLPIPLSMLNRGLSDKDKIISILENMQRMMDGTDEKVLRDFERAIDNARDKVTEEALDQFHALSDEEIYQLLTSGYLAELQREFQRIIENQIQHMIRFHNPSLEEQRLYVSEEINERYPRLPRFLKWLLTNNPQLENDPLIREWLNTIQTRMNRIPPFPEMITEYSKTALNKSLYLNPELAMRVILHFARGMDQDRSITEGQIRKEIESELARNLPEDVIKPPSEIIEEKEILAELPFVSQPKALPAPDIKKREKLKARLKATSDDYTQFMANLSEQEALVKKTEADFAELSEGLDEARKENDKVVIGALKPAVEGLKSKLQRVKADFKKLEKEKEKFEEQIKQLKDELGESEGTTLYSLDPISIVFISVATALFGIPLYLTKKIVYKISKTSGVRAVSMIIASAVLFGGYYLIFPELFSASQQAIVNLKFPQEFLGDGLCPFILLWPATIIIGTITSLVGREISESSQFDKLYNKGHKAFNKKEYVEAITLFAEAVKLRPKDNLSHFWLASSLEEVDKTDEAIQEYGKAIKLNPNDSVSHNNLGVLYALKKQDDKALEYYNRSFELQPNDPIVLWNLGRALRRKGQLLEAAKILQRAQQIKPDSAVTEELNQILQQTGRVEKSKEPSDLPYIETMRETVPSRSEWIGSVYSDIGEWGGGVVFLGLLAAGGFLYGAYHFHWWQLGTEQVTTTTKWIVWLSAGITGSLLAIGFPLIIGKAIDVFKTIWRFFKYPLDYRRLEKVNKKPSDELSDRDLSKVAPIYARMSKDYLEKIFRSWMDAGHEEKIARLFKFGKWKSEKICIYADIGEYKKASRASATKFATTQNEQKAIFDAIDAQKEKLTQKDLSNAVALLKDILPQITEHSRNREEFLYWLGLIVDLPVNIWNQGSRQILTVFTDLREFRRRQEEALQKYATNIQQQAKVTKAINDLKVKLDKEGFNSIGILKSVLAEVNKASRNLDEFLSWMNELMQFEKRIWSSGSQLSILQSLIAYVRAKEEGSKKLCKTSEETSSLFQAVDNLRTELQRQGVSGDVSILKDVIPRVTEASRNLAEFFEYITVLKSFDKNIWYGTQSVLQAFNNHVSYKQAREQAADKFAKNDAERKKFLSDINTLREQLVQKGFPQASDLLKDILRELTKTCRTKEEFIYWLGELIGLNVSVWRSGAQVVVNNFNDLAGFKQVKEMSLDKLGTNQQEKDELSKTIDSLKAKLEEKRPSCAGLIKDVILEILKDIDTLSDPPYRRTDFIYWLTMCVNFEASTWQAGIKQVLAGYQQLKDYKKQRQELFSKFTTNPDEQKRLTSTWDSLEKTVNFTRVSKITLLKNTTVKIAGFANNPREFVFWIGTLSELNPEILEVFCRDIATVFEYYKDKGKARDFNHLPAVLNQYHKTYHQTVLITANLLDILTDPSIDIDKRVEKASHYIIEQKIVKLGAPPNLVGLKDAVSFEQLLAIAGESGFSSLLNFHWQEESYDSEYGSSYSDTGNQPICQIVPKMGRDGMYSYWEAQRAPYYQQFLEETKGLAPDFRRPGEKFRVAYDDRVVTWSKEDEAQIIPISDSIQALRQLIQYLRMEWPNLYENFTGPKREIIKGRPMEEFVTSDTVLKMAENLLGKVQNWQFSEQQRAVFLIKIMEIFSFSETADLRVRITNATDDFNKLRLIAQYWERVLELVVKHKWLQEKSKFYQSIAKIIRQRIATINDKVGDGGKGVLQFYLSGGTVADFFRGIVSCDCTKPGGQAFQNTIGAIIDPGFFLFKIIENGRWVGNIYSIVFKTQDNKFALFVDVFQLSLQHPLVAQADNWNGKRDRFIHAFFKELKSYLASQGFDYLIFANTHSSQKIGTNIHNEVVKESGKSSTESISVKKPGGTSHLAEAGLSIEYVQGAGNISNGFQNVSGYKITLDKTTPQVMQQKQKDLDYLEKLLGEISQEEIRLLNLIKDKQTELTQIAKKGFEAANAGKETLANALMKAHEQKKVEIQKIDYEVGELKAKMQEKRQEAERLRADLGIFRTVKTQAASSALSFVGKAISFVTFAGMLNMFFSDPAQAQELSYTEKLLFDVFAPFVIVGGIAGLFGLIYYVLNKIFPEGPKVTSYYETSYSKKPFFEEYKLPEDITAQLGKVLEKVSPELQELVLRHIDIRVPYEVGISRNQALKALRLLFSKLIEHGSILDFLKGQEFYKSFKQRAKELGLADDFDQPEHSYFFSVAKEKVRYEEDRRAEEFIQDYLAKLRRDCKLSISEHRSTDTELLDRIAKERMRLKKKVGYIAKAQGELYEYYRLLKVLAYQRFQDKLESLDRLLAVHKYLEALSILEEFLRVGIGAELIVLEQDSLLREALSKILDRELENIHWQFNRLTAFQAKRTEVLQGASDIQYEVRVSNRTADDILRGEASGDCTAINGSAFYNTIPQFLFDPGFLAFKVYQDNKWVGNVYAIVAEKENNPVLIIDAMQLPVWGRSWPISVRELADRVLEKMIDYASSQGFAQVLMSSFISNFTAIYQHFDSRYPSQEMEIEKVEGFEHLKALGLWDGRAYRNEYIETFSPQWNQPLRRKIDANNPKQSLLLRKVWQRAEEPQASSALQPDLTHEVTVQVASNNKDGFFRSALHFIQRKARIAVAVAIIFIMFALPNLANAAKLKFTSEPSPNQKQIVAVAERKDTLWDIAGIAYRDKEEVGKTKFAPHLKWSKIYEANPQIHNRPGNALRPMYPDGAHYKNDKQLIVNIQPGDRLIIPDLTQEVTKPTAPSQQEYLQKQQELTKLKEQNQAVRAELERSQREKAELTQQILDLKRQLADMQEQLEKTKGKIPSTLQTEEAKRKALEEETKQFEQKKAQYVKEIAALEKQRQQAQEDLKQITFQKEKAAQDLERLKKQSPQAQEQIKNLQDQIQNLESQKKQHQDELNNLQSQKDTLQKGIDLLNQDRDRLQKDLQDLKQQIAEAKKILEEAKQRIQPTWKNIWDGLSWPAKTGIIILLLTAIGSIGAGVILIRRWAKFKSLEAKIDRLNKEAEDLQAKVDSLQKEEKDFIKIKEDAQKAKLEAEEQAKKIAQQQVQLEEERKRLEQETLDLQRQKEEIEKEKHELVKLDEQKQALVDEIGRLKTQRDNLKESLAQAEKKTREAIRKARELEEQAKAQAQISQEALTEEQRKLQEQLVTKKQEVTTQINALEEELSKARVRRQLDLAEIEEAKSKVKSELDKLLLEKDKTEKDLRDMNATISKLNEERNKLLEGLQDLDTQQRGLRESIERLRQEEARLKAEVEELTKKAAEIKPEVKSFLEQVQDLREEVYNALGKIASVHDIKITSTLISQLKNILGSDVEIMEAPISGATGKENVIAKINATKGYENLPVVILNAHKDIHDHGYHIGINDKDEFFKTGALDDRAGVVSILQSLRLLKERFGKENIPHGPLLVIFTDLEERGFKGAYDLKDKYENNSSGYESLFDNTYLIITVDGPLDWETDEFLSDNIPFVIAGSYPKGDLRYKAIYDAVRKLSYPESQVPRCPVSDGMGDHHVFRRITDKKTGQNLFVVNLRAPHTGSRENYHTNKEKTNIDEQLTPFALWLTECVIQLNTVLLNKKAGSAKGKGMFAPEEHAEVNDVILNAMKEGRGYLIWGDAKGWRSPKEKDKYTQDISWGISGLRRYPKVHIQGLGTIDIPEVLTASDIILILPRNNSPPGLIVKSKDAYQIAHSGPTFNSIYIDEAIYKHLYSFEIAVLLAHEAIELGAKQIAQRKHISWTIELAEKVHHLAEKYEIQIVGKSPNGTGSRFDDRVEEMLGLTKQQQEVKEKPQQDKRLEEQPINTQPIPKIMTTKPQESEEKSKEATVSMPKKAKVEEPPRSAKVLTLEYPESQNNQDTINNLRKIFLEGLFKNNSLNLPASLESFPAPIAQEIRYSYQVNKVKGMPLDADVLVALTLFFSHLFPNHTNKLINYMKNLSIYLVDNLRSTYGATLSGNTFYIQRSCIQDLVGRPITVDEIYKGIEAKDPEILVAIFRIIIHEIGSAFFKLSHHANQELERLFLAALSKTKIQVQFMVEQEIRNINNTVNLDNIVRIDWAEKRSPTINFSLQNNFPLKLDNLFAVTEELAPKLINSLYDPNENIRNDASEALARLGFTKALTFLKLLQEKEPQNEIVKKAVEALEQKAKEEQGLKLKAKMPDPFAKALFTLDKEDNLVLTLEAVHTLNMLYIDYSGLTLEIDVDTLIDTSKGIPQLKGYGFKEAVVALFKSQQEKEIPEDLRVRLINLNSNLSKEQIIKSLGLTEDLLKTLVYIPDIPEDYLIKGLETYLVAGSIRIVFEDNAKYWGEKIDVLVKKGEETQVLSSLGLIVAALAKEPKFYQELPQEIKDYIVAVTDEEGNVKLDDDNKIKQLIFKPIEKTKIDTQYLEQLDKANKELEGMV